MQQKNRQWILNERPRGAINADTYRVREQSIPDLADGEVLVKTLYLSFDPAQRAWMDDIPSYMPPVQLGEPMRASGVGQVIASRHPDFPQGALVSGLLGWQEYVQVAAGATGMLRSVPKGMPPTYPLSVFGGTSMTAYFGLLEVGRPQPGETVVVSGAGGATGSMVCQIAKIKGCRVIGIAGGEEKCRWLREACGIEHVIDYKSAALDQRLGELCPNGINLFFDNVGGKTLETVIDHMADFGRMVLCGAISSYNDAEPTPGPRNMFQLITRRIRMQGFIVADHLQNIAQFRQEFGAWVSAGNVVWREDIQEGFDNIPATLQRLFDGRNQGKQLLKLADPE